MRFTSNQAVRLCCALMMLLVGFGPMTSRVEAQVDEQIRQTTRDQVQRVERGQRDATETRGFFAGVNRLRTGTRAGGWSSVTYLTLDQIDHNKARQDPINNLILTDQRAWISHDFDSRKSVYLRLRKLNFDFGTAPGIPVGDLRTKEQLDLDLGYFDFRVGRTQLRLGRQFEAIGRGLVLAQILDGIQGEHRFDSGIGLRGFAATSLHRTDNLDARVSGFDRGHNDRTFIGLQSDYHTPRRKVRLYGFGLSQIDRTTNEDPARDRLDLRYQSHYVGFGAEGTLRRRLSFAGEHVRQGGSSQGFDGRADIEATATTMNLAYRFPTVSKPVATLDYAFGSGDPNRLSVTSNLDLGASARGGDENFLYFGQYDGGLALSPRLSNLRVWRAGMRSHPFARSLRWPSDLVAGFKISTYHKDRPRGAISDPLASLGFSDVGSALDLFTSWKVLSDVNLLVEYGTFKPSRAYPEPLRDLTSRLAVTATVSF